MSYIVLNFIYFTDIQSTEDFRNCDGPKIIVDVLKESSHDIKQLDSGFSVVAAAATGNEVVKELFMDLKIDEFILETMKGPLKGHIQSLYDAVRVLLTPDDNRVLVSQVSFVKFNILYFFVSLFSSIKHLSLNIFVVFRDRVDRYL